MKKEVPKLASLYIEKKMNSMVYEANIIPKSTYEKVDEEIALEIDKYEKICFFEENEYTMAGVSGGFT